MKRLIQTKKGGERCVLPDVKELNLIENARSILVPVYYLNGAWDLFAVESYHSISDLKRLVMEKYKFG